MGDELDELLEREILRLRDNYHKLDGSVTGLKHQVDDLREWRRRDEPRILQLVQDATVADQVRAALNEHRGREWTRVQKVLGALVGVPAFVAAWIGLIAELHHLFP